LVQSAHEGSKVVSPTHRPPLLSRPVDHSAAGRIISMENSNDIIGNRTRDLPTCSAVPNPTKNSECLVNIMKVSASLSNGVEQSSLEKLTVPQLAKKFPALYGTRRFVAVFTTAYHSSQC